jgi:hypothetical protein
MKFRIPVVCAIALALTPLANAKFAMPTPTPVDRIVKNTEARLAQKPDDLELRYELARVHYLAFALKKGTLGAFVPKGEEATADKVASRMFQGWSDKKEPELNMAQAIQHAASAAKLFQEVLEKNPKHTMANLGYASLLDQFATEAANSPLKEEPAALAKRDRPTIRKHYATAFDEAWKKDQSATSQDVDGLNSFVSYEAAKSYLRNASVDEPKLTAEEKETARRMSDAIKKLDALPRGPITPLVFSFEPAESIDALLAPEVTVDFDLRGFGLKERWPWLRPGAGVLVWDPANEGRITSARQMFGSYSWQLFWRNGFEALAALDDNQDGWLRGAELEGIGLWFDRNQNAISDDGEVTPLSALGVAALACTAPEAEGPHPLNRLGVEMRDGRVLPLWDWVTSPRPARREMASRKRELPAHE